MIWKCFSFVALFLALGCKEKSTEPPVLKTAAEAIPPKVVSNFSGAEAFKHVEALTVAGPRPSGSAGYEKALIYLEKSLQQLGWRTKRQTFQGKTPIGDVSFTNLLARFSPDSDANWEHSAPYLIGGHLDTKRYPGLHFVGANDSGSSTGVMIELARVLSEHPASATSVELIFFDGEEAILENISSEDGLYGSRYYAAQLDYRASKPILAIVLDIIGDRSIPLLIGNDSDPNLRSHAIAAARKLKLNDWVNPYEQGIIDDHVPLMVRGHLPVLHLIGAFMKAPYWHKVDDDLRHISPGALEQTGRLTLQILSQLSAQ